MSEKTQKYRGVWCCLRKGSQAYIPIILSGKREKNMITQNFNTGRLVTKKKNTQCLLPLWKSKLGQGLFLSYKKCQNCDKFGHEDSQCRNRKIIKNRVRHTKSEDESDEVVRKYITVKVLTKSVRLPLHSGSDRSINLQTWRKLNRPIIKMTSKTARTVTGDKIKFEGEIIIPVSLNGITKKLSLRTEEHRKFVWVGLVSEI